MRSAFNQLLNASLPMIPGGLRSVACTLAVGVLMPSAPARAETLNWTAFANVAFLDTTSGSLVATLTNVDNSGVDVRVTLTGSIDQSRNDSPEVNQILHGGFTTGDERDNLFIRVDSANANDSLTLGFEFFITGTHTPQTVTDVNFLLFDIDTSRGYNPSWIDQVSDFSAANVYTGDTTSLTNLVAQDPSSDLVISPGGGTATGTGGQAPNKGSNSGEANLVADYENFTMTEFSFQYNNFGNSGSSSGIGVHDIHFTVVPIPEPSTWIAGLSLFAAIGWVHRQKRARQRER